MLESGELTQDKFEEDWLVKINTGGEYHLSKIQAQILQQAIAQGERGVVMFKTFAISIPYIAEFYMVKRFLKDALKLSARNMEQEYEQIPKEKFEQIKKEAYAKIGKVIKK